MIVVMKKVVAVDFIWRKTTMKAILKKSIAALMAIFTMFAIPLTSYAAEQTTNINTTEVSTSNSAIAPCAYYDPPSFTFWDYNRGEQHWYDGGHMAAEITASSNTPGLTMQVTAHIVGKGSVNWTVKVDGKMHKKDWIGFGTSSGRNVYFTYSCSQNPNAKITVHNKSYSW